MIQVNITALHRADRPVPPRDASPRAADGILKRSGRSPGSSRGPLIGGVLRHEGVRELALGGRSDDELSGFGHYRDVPMPRGRPRSEFQAVAGVAARVERDAGDGTRGPWLRPGVAPGWRRGKRAGDPGVRQPAADLRRAVSCRGGVVTAAVRRMQAEAAVKPKKWAADQRRINGRSENTSSLRTALRRNVFLRRLCVVAPPDPAPLHPGRRDTERPEKDVTTPERRNEGVSCGFCC